MNLYATQGNAAAQTSTPEDLFEQPEQPFGARPENTYALELPVYGVPAPDRVWQLEAALQSLKNGIFYDAACYWDAMMDTAEIKGPITTRINGVLGAGIDFSSDPDGGKEQAAKIAEELRDKWPRMHSDAALSKLIRYVLGTGIAVAEKLYASGDRWDYRLRIWHNKYIYWRDDTRAYHLQTQNRGLIQLPRPGEHSSQWMVFAPFGYDAAYLEGLFGALRLPWLGFNWSDRDWNRYNEVHGLAIRKAVVPQSARDEDKKAFVLRVSQLNAETTIRCPQDKDGNKFDLELLEAQADGWQTFDKRIESSRKSVAIAVLGQATSTLGSSGLGSDKNPGDAVRLDIKRSDNSGLSQFLYDQGIREWAAFNFGDPDLAPKPPQDDKRSGYYQVEPPEDSAKAAAQALAIAQSCAQFKMADAPVSMRAYLDGFGIPVETEQEEAQRKAKAMAEQQQRMAQMQTIGASPSDGDKPSSAASGGDAPPTNSKEPA